MAAGDARARLLTRAVDHVAERGLTDLSLRELAAAIGTSHRMLLHHFGSREELWVAVVQEVEARTRATLTGFVPDPETDGAEAMRAFWRHLSDPVLWPNERLFFEVYGQALQGRPGTTQLLDGVVEDWLGPATATHVARGMTPEAARAHARLGLAVTRGLLLDLLATGDREGTDAAMEAWIALAAGPDETAPVSAPGRLARVPGSRRRDGRGEHHGSQSHRDRHGSGDRGPRAARRGTGRRAAAGARLLRAERRPVLPGQRDDPAL